MKKEADEAIQSLLGDLSEVPIDHIRDVAFIKRFLERWTMDPEFRDAFAADAETALAHLGLSLHPEQVLPFIDDEVASALAHALHDGTADDWPLSVRRYRAFCQEKRAHRRQIRRDCEPAHPRLAAWRRRQLYRCIGELGGLKADAIVHAPAAFELSKGCTVGCWFCGVAAPRFDHAWHYTEENAELWRTTLGVLREVIGPCAQQGFLYWATDPLDNPDYERFLVDFYNALGRCPQTTTALGAKDIERTRQLLRLSHSMGSTIDRFSITTLKRLNQIHEALSAEEILRVECIPQNREASAQYRKANAGRARKFAQKKSAELAPIEASSTIACVSGFLFNMIDRSVQLVTPCSANERWPLGYWVLDRGTFNTGEELRKLLETMIDAHLRPALKVTDIIRFRPDVQVKVEHGELRVLGRGMRVILSGQPSLDELTTLIAGGSYTAEEIALRRERETAVPLAETFVLLDHMFAHGLFDEEPATPDEPDLITVRDQPGGTR